MSNQSDKIILHVISKINEVSADSWDACAGSSNPFVSHAFLSALEESGSVTNETGWMPQHLIAKGKKDDVVACMPMYLKNHSYGEYIFDWGWADAFNRAGGQYYPKLQVAIPFTPVTGPRMLVRKGDPQTYQKILINGMLKLVEKHNVSSLHITFPEKKEWDVLGNAGFIQRTSKQFHWQNQGYRSFDQFLDKLASR